jgi:hypothetical protein
MSKDKDSPTSLPPENRQQSNAAAPGADGPCMYLGPSRPFGLPLMHNAILRGAPEAVFPALTALFAEHKEFRRLFVRTPDLAEARRRMAVPGSDLARAHDAIKQASAAALRK